MPEAPPLPYSTRMRLCLAIARGIAATRGDTDITPLHVALGILREGENPAVAALTHAGVATAKVRVEIERALGQPRGWPRPGEVCIGTTPGEQRVVEEACRASRERGDEYLGPHHLLLALVQDSDSQTAQIFARHGIDTASARTHVDAVFVGHQH
jgi:ATP-dependent Clp protease ATP-binding subunit ClpC